ncbi:RNA polymerase II mediator complex component [Fusarium subglutinans]|uniref:RNA polymerase II mediator complex component n=1 Tax=Gibberella subglutinans TaxID=42677 RepID=A0A8H5L668_GIBSU|nr:RNA polymerase II mediator complex component [Fusarium subglutinans]KAF5587114.1 RNA polymerase II mediator complex component [Fusarium subglutinans]
MGRKTKQKSCFACVETKRRCDKRYPSCSRCLDRESVCTYPSLPRRQPLDLIEAEAAPDVGFGDMWTSAADTSNLALVGEMSEQWLLDPIFSTNLNCLSIPSWTPPLSDPSSLPGSSSGGTADSGQLTQKSRDLSWFLGPQSWTIGYHYNAPDVIHPASVFTNFIRGLQNWLSRFVKTGHNPFIHRHLYSDSGYPQCIQDAYSACVISSSASSENETIVNAISATHITNLLNDQPTGGTSIISTRDHLARTQALLIHILLALFSSSIERRARAENLISLLHAWKNQLWESATHDSTLASPLPILATPSGTAVGELDPIPGLYRSFILSESIRRTGLLCNIATGVYGGLKGSNIQSCGGDIQITTQAKFWEASSSARWEAVARQTDPLFIYSLKGQMLLEQGVVAAEVDDFARHLFTIMWGLEKVETWVVRTGDEVSVVY